MDRTDKSNLEIRKRQFSLASLLLLLLFAAMLSLLFVQYRTNRALRREIQSLQSAARLDDQLLSLKAQELSYQRLFGPNHPQVQAIRQKIEAVERALVDNAARNVETLGTE